jgi:integrase
MPRLYLTDIAVRALKVPASGQVDYWDEMTRAFGVRVSQAGTKTFVAKVKNRRVTIGRYPDVSLADARRKANGVKSETQPVDRSNITFEQAYEKFKAEHTAKKRERTKYDYERVLEKYFLPPFAKTRMVKITYEKVTEITDKLADRPSEQAHTLSVARTFFKWCARPPRRYAASPLDGLQLTLAKSRKRTLSDEEIIKVWTAAERQGYPHGTIVQLLLLTGQRRGEIAWLQRSWFNAKNRTITLPDWLTKNKRQHTLPFGEMAAHIFEGVPRFNSTELLFPTRWAADRPLSGWSKFKHEMADGLPRWTLHDLRRTFATRLAELKVAPHVVERLLNHKMGGITNKTDGIVSAVAEVYNRAAYLPEMREAVALWEQHLGALIAEGRRSHGLRAA